VKKLVVTFALLGVALAQAKSFHVTLYEKSVLGSTELKPGEYTIEVKDQQVLVKNGKLEAQAPVKVENESAKFGTTTVRYSNGDGRYHIQEIRLGGTNMKLVVTSGDSAKAGSDRATQSAN
jgi:hypothetical protein